MTAMIETTLMNLEENNLGTSTQSTCVVEMVEGSHCFTLNGYSTTRGIGLGNSIVSERFTVGGHQWAIHFYPDGKSAEDEEYIAAYVVAITSDGEDVRVKLELSLLDPSINGYRLGQQAVWSRLEHPIVCPYRTLQNGEMWGSSQFCLRGFLDRYGFVENDILSIRCKVSVMVSGTTGVNPHSISVPEPDIPEDWGALWDSVTGDSSSGDVTFDVEGELFTAHRLVLETRSSVFKSQLYGPTPCGNSNKFHVEDMIAPVFRGLLHYIYTDRLPDMSGVQATGLFPTVMMQHLLVAADRYRLNRLRLLCESKLCELMSVDTVAITLIFAEEHHAAELKARCLKYAAANIRAVMLSDGNNCLKNSCPSLGWELLGAVADLRQQ